MRTNFIRNSIQGFHHYSNESIKEHFKSSQFQFPLRLKYSRHNTHKHSLEYSIRFKGINGSKGQKEQRSTVLGKKLLFSLKIEVYM